MLAVDGPVGPGARFARFFVAAALLGSLANLGVTIALPGNSQPIRQHGSGLGDFLGGEQRHVAERYEAYGELRDLAAGGSIVIPRKVLDAYTLTQLSDLTVTKVAGRRRVAEAALETAGPFQLHEGTTELTMGGEKVPYVIAVMDPGASEFVAVVTRRSGTILIVDRALADEIGAK